MADALDVPEDLGRPDPAGVNTSAEFVEVMRRLKRWTGLGYRQLEKRAAAEGQVLPRSTLTAALARSALPREDLVVAFARACGCDEDQTAQWVAVRRRIAAGGTPVEQEPVGTVLAPLPLKRRAKWPVRIAIVVLALAVVAVIGTRLFDSSGPSVAQQRPDQAVPAGPGSSQPPPSSSPPPSGIVSGAPQVIPPDQAERTPPSTAPAATAKTTTASPPAPTTVSSPPVSQPTTPPETPPPPAEPGRRTIELPGQPVIHCPMPYLGTGYGPLAQCTQPSDSQARSGFYSPITGEFNPTTNWSGIVETKWYDGSVLATDGVEAWARGYGSTETNYGPWVFATQYRVGEARWGTINLVSGRFHPGPDGWHPLGP
ncbi:helix-turn-helix domain-containing protein [Kibdelosporangium aridum]|uniref:Helix-turn-helix domain-containing protein n=1 Tax=Kibdelosporangium aridum TaxID=2030 RepID=A0A1Y5Y3Y5_KIBAR|nr:helix-turn-helix transcriptional regulator [Kibdelosporangium aridum]SMD25385.1 hypothetical protein SAMN05661093_09082 [Kibdelosporangium aridum]